MVLPSLKIRFFDKKPSFKKDVKRLDQKVVDDLDKALGELQTELPPGRNLKKLQGTANVYSIRIGRDYRLSFELDGDKAILRRIGPRQKFYDSF